MFVGFWKDGLLAEIQARMSRSCRFLLFLHHNYQVSLRWLSTWRIIYSLINSQGFSMTENYALCQWGIPLFHHAYAFLLLCHWGNWLPFGPGKGVVLQCFEGIWLRYSVARGKITLMTMTHSVGSNWGVPIEKVSNFPEILIWNSYLKEDHIRQKAGFFYCPKAMSKSEDI